MASRSRLFIAAAMMAASYNGGMQDDSSPRPTYVRHIESPKRYLRKKCKSCGEWTGSRCLIKAYKYPMDQACQEYKSKK